jgi:two-component system LytT family response regulator
MRQIEVAEADRNSVSLIVGRDTFHSRSTLQQAQKTLQSQPMLRISRSCLVNVNPLREVSRTRAAISSWCSPVAPR